MLALFTLPSLRQLPEPDPDPGLPTLATLPLRLLTLLLLLLTQLLLLGLSLSHLSTLLLLLFTEAAEAEGLFGKTLRTQLSKLDTNVPSSTAEQPVVVEGEAALYREAEVICLLIGIATGIGETDNGVELTEVAAVVEQENAIGVDCC